MQRSRHGPLTTDTHGRIGSARFAMLTEHRSDVRVETVCHLVFGATTFESISEDTSIEANVVWGIDIDANLTQVN